MVKRSADGNFTQENWDLEEPAEEPEVGKFERASEDVLARRKILVGRRRMPERKQEPEVNPFANFKGFKGLSFSAGPPILETPGGAALSGLASEAPKPAILGERTAASTAFGLKSSPRVADTSASLPAKKADKGGVPSSDMPTSKSKRRLSDMKESKLLGYDPEKDYGPLRVSDVGVELLTKIKALNKEFVEHVTKYFQQNPFINFKPAFNDYLAHMDRLQRENGITEDAALWKIREEPAGRGSSAAAPYQFKQPSGEATLAGKPAKEAGAPKSSATATPFLFKKLPGETNATGGLNKEASEESRTTLPPFLFNPRGAARTGGLTMDPTPAEPFSPAKKQRKGTLPKNTHVDDSNRVKPTESFFKFLKPTTGVSSHDEGVKGSSSATTCMGRESAASDNLGAASQSRPFFRFGLQKSGDDSGKVPFLPPIPSQSLFRFGLQQPSVYGESSAVAPEGDENDAQEEEEEGSSPTLNVMEIPPEEGSIHNVRCKLYYLDEEKKYNDRGVGQLYVKPLGNGRVQLIIRADNIIRNILLNVAIDKSTPIAKAAKSSLSVVVVPNPPIGGEAPEKPTLALLRVKTDDHLAELWESIEEAKEQGEASSSFGDSESDALPLVGSSLLRSEQFEAIAKNRRGPS